jgi:hypothetical protein
MAIMQPYFFPYIGYWQLIHAFDRFVIYNDVNYAGLLPHTQLASARGVVLPMRMEVSEMVITTVTAIIRVIVRA